MYKVIKCFTSSETPAMSKLSYRLKSYLMSFYRITSVDKYHIYVDPDGESVNKFANSLVDFLSGEILNIENNKFLIESHTGVRVTAGTPGKFDDWCPENCYMVEIMSPN